ncbi:MAG: D-alanyl-D-alanine carboxypeptidase family protein [Clostridia bacterium]
MERKSFLIRRKRNQKKGTVFFCLFCAAVLIMSLCGFAGAFSLCGGAESAGDPGAWNLILVNGEHPVPWGYGNRQEFTELKNGEFVDSRIYPSLQRMFDDARSAGVYPVVASGYRSREQQARLLEEKTAAYLGEGRGKEDARRLALTYCARPGTSEHELGLAVDINADPQYSSGGEVYDWLARNARRYGFIRRYPENKKAWTGIADEPWHYRYVGKEAAEIIENNGLCLEEYLEQIEKGIR